MKGGVRFAAVAAVFGVSAALAFWPRDEATTMTMVAAERDLAPRCPAPGQPVAFGRELRLSVWRGDTVAEAEITDQLERAASYYADYGVKLFRAPTEALGRERLIEGSRTDLERALRRAGFDPAARLSGDREAAARRVVCEAALGPLKRFIAERADADTVNLVVLRRIADPGSAIAAILPDLRGLTLDPRSTSEALKSCLGLADDSPATVVIGLDGIAGRRPKTVDVTLAHELGHVLGLSHPEGNGATEDLMATDPPACVPALTAAQVEQIRSW